MRFDRLTAVCTSLERIYREKWQKEDKNKYLIVRHETLESTYRPGVRRYRLWVEVLNDRGKVIDIVQGQVEETQTYCLISEDEFEDLVFHDLEGNLITELIRYFYDKIL